MLSVYDRISQGEGKNAGPVAPHIIFHARHMSVSHSAHDTPRKVVNTLRQHTAIDRDRGPCGVA